jgi:hypothetical protein
MPILVGACSDQRVVARWAINSVRQSILAPEVSAIRIANRWSINSVGCVAQHVGNGVLALSDAVIPSYGVDEGQPEVGRLPV